MKTDRFPRQFGKYQLLAPLAQGGMGALYLAIAGDSGMEKLCAIKTVIPHLADAEYISRFRDEAKVVVKLSHGNLVPVFDAGQVEGEIFLAMDFIEGKDLRAVWNRCAQKGVAFPVDVAAHIVKELCRGLAYAHSFGDLRLVHRDVSPPNVLISFTGEIKLTDFGLASSTLKLEKTAPGVIYGKVSYMSPEQARGEPPDGRTDLYAAGIILWELLTGRQLFPLGQDQPQDVLARARNPSTIPPSKRAPRVPASLDSIVMTALAPSPAKRYQAGEEMRVALAGWLAQEAPATDTARLSQFVASLFAEEIAKERAEREALIEKARRELSRRSAGLAGAAGVGADSGHGGRARRGGRAAAVGGVGNADGVSSGVGVASASASAGAGAAGVGANANANARAGSGSGAGSIGGTGGRQPMAAFGAKARGELAGRPTRIRLSTPRVGGEPKPELEAALGGTHKGVAPAKTPRVNADSADSDSATVVALRGTIPATAIAPAMAHGFGSLKQIIGQLVDGRYRVRALIGEGGMGRVYEAEHVEIGKRVALKILHPVYSRTPEVVERFRREARAASRIGHPNIVDVTDSGTTGDGSIYFVMEHLEGVELAAVIERENRLDVHRALHIGMQICRAVAAAHNAGIIHRDLKPENIFLVVREGIPDFVKVLDFGIAKSAELDESRRERLTHPGMAMGTPEYMAPEQAAGKPADARSDVYAVGAIVYEMLTGNPPYEGENFMEILTKKATIEPPSPREFRPEISENVEKVVLRALARDPDERPQSMEAFEYELIKCVSGRGAAVAKMLGMTLDPAIIREGGAGAVLDGALAGPVVGSAATTRPADPGSAAVARRSLSAVRRWFVSRPFHLAISLTLVGLISLVGIWYGLSSKETPKGGRHRTAAAQRESGRSTSIARGGSEGVPDAGRAIAIAGTDADQAPAKAQTGDQVLPGAENNRHSGARPGLSERDGSGNGSAGEGEGEGEGLAKPAKSKDSRQSDSGDRGRTEATPTAPSRSHEELRRLAIRYFERRDIEKAIEYAKEARDAGGGDSANLLLGQFLLRDDRCAEAMRALRQIRDPSTTAKKMMREVDKKIQIGSCR
ncbi:MAG: serine/threonine-protein kinase [Pseudomonadota bacterium]